MSRSNPLNRGLNTYIPALGNGRQRLSGDEPALPIALDMLRDKETRQRASGVLVRLGDPAAVALLDWVHDDDAPVREAATWTLARIKARRWVRGLLKANEWTYQHTTALPNTISYRSLTHAVAVGSVPSRAMAALALGRLGEDRALFELIELLTSQHAICRMAAMHPGVGAPLAAGLMEEAIYLGCRKFVACGGAGVLNSEIAMGHVIVPTAAVRDEGTSYHYLPPGREVSASPEGVAAISHVLEQHEIPYVQGKTWTTDAFYRETPGKIERRKAEGCISVEMEAAAFFAVAQFRGVICGQMLYGGDDVGGSQWDSRGWEKAASMREKLFWLAAEAALALPDGP